MSSEKNTDRYLQNSFEQVFGEEYQTSTNLFQGKIPDGFYKCDSFTFIMENKRYVKDAQLGIQQLQKYKELYKKDADEKVYFVLGRGASKKSFKYFIYDYDFNLTEFQFENFVKGPQKPKFNKEQAFHDINQYLYDNSINLPKSQKTLFIAAILICLKEDTNYIQTKQLQNSTGFTIAQSMIDTIQQRYDDTAFVNQFDFIKKSIHNNQLLKLFQMIHDDIIQYQGDILNSFYSEFNIWDKNNDAQLGVVLTPHDIVQIMVKLLDIKQQDKVLDFCTGTGSFLLEAGNYSKNLYGCENNIERYSLAKCGFILKNLDYYNLKYNSCFNQPYQKEFDKIIINPPFSCNCQDEYNTLNTTNWKSFKDEQKFVIYSIELLKENGLGCIIIPRSNFNNNTQQQLTFKQQLLKFITPLKIICLNSKIFYPNAGVQCSIMLFQKKQYNNELVNIYDFENDGYQIKKSIRLFKEYINWENIKQQCVLKAEDDWNYQKNILDNLNIEEMIKQYNKDNYY